MTGVGRRPGLGGRRRRRSRPGLRRRAPRGRRAWPSWSSCTGAGPSAPRLRRVVWAAALVGAVGEHGRAARAGRPRHRAGASARSSTTACWPRWPRTASDSASCWRWSGCCVAVSTGRAQPADRAGGRGRGGRLLRHQRAHAGGLLGGRSPRSPTSPTCWPRPRGAAAWCCSRSASVPGVEPRRDHDGHGRAGRPVLDAGHGHHRAGRAQRRRPGVDRGRIARRPHEHRATGASCWSRSPSWPSSRPSAPTTTSGSSPPSRAGRPRRRSPSSARRSTLEVVGPGRRRRAHLACSSSSPPPGRHRRAAWSRRSCRLGDAGSVQLTIAPAKAGLQPDPPVHLRPRGPARRHRRVHHPRAQPARRPARADHARGDPGRARPTSSSTGRPRRRWHLDHRGAAPASTASPRPPARSRSPLPAERRGHRRRTRHDRRHGPTRAPRRHLARPGAGRPPRPPPPTPPGRATSAPR